MDPLAAAPAADTPAAAPAAAAESAMTANPGPNCQQAAPASPEAAAEGGAAGAGAAPGEAGQAPGKPPAARADSGAGSGAAQDGGAASEGLAAGPIDSGREDAKSAAIMTEGATKQDGFRDGSAGTGDVEAKAEAEGKGEASGDMNNAAAAAEGAERQEGAGVVDGDEDDDDDEFEEFMPATVPAHARVELLVRLFPGISFVQRLQQSPTKRRLVEAMPPHEFEKLVMVVQSRTQGYRKRCVEIRSLAQVASLIKSSRRILVLTGAGISTSCGIPDFRSSHGVYSMLDGYKLKDPQDLFSIHYFRRNTKPFYDFARKLWPGTHEPAPTHYFIKRLETHGHLHRNYTQNIDTLECVAGIERVLQCHGSFATATCTRCKYRCEGDRIKDDIMNKRAPVCPRCAQSPPSSLMEEVVMRDPSMRAFRFGGGRSNSISSESDLESDLGLRGSPSHAAQARAQASASASNHHSLSTAPNSGSTPEAEGQHVPQPEPFSAPASIEERNSTVSLSGPIAGTQNSTSAVDSAHVSEAQPKIRPTVAVSTSAAAAHRAIGGSHGHGSSFEPDSPFASSAKKVFGNNAGHHQPSGLQHSSGSLNKQQNQQGKDQSKRPGIRTNSLASDGDPMVPPSPTLSQLSRSNSLSSLATPRANVLSRSYLRSAAEAADSSSKLQTQSDDFDTIKSEKDASSLAAVKAEASLLPMDMAQDMASKEALSTADENGHVDDDNTNNNNLLPSDVQALYAAHGNQDDDPKGTGLDPMPVQATPEEHMPPTEITTARPHGGASADVSMGSFSSSVSSAAAMPPVAPPANDNGPTAMEISKPSQSQEHEHVDRAEESHRENSTDSHAEFDVAKDGDLLEDELPFVDEMFDKGIMKPDIVFFGESLPNEFFDCIEEDVRLCDMVIVLGTSLKVAPVSRIIEMVDPEIPQILINREVVAQPHQFDAELLGNCDAVVAALARELNWDLPGVASPSNESTGENDGEPDDDAVANEEGEDVTGEPTAYRQHENRPHRFLFQGAYEDSDDEEDSDEDDSDLENGENDASDESSSSDEENNEAQELGPDMVARDRAEGSMSSIDQELGDKRPPKAGLEGSPKRARMNGSFSNTIE